MTDEALRAYLDLCGGRGNLARIIRQGIDNTVLHKALRDENGKSPKPDIVISESEGETS